MHGFVHHLYTIAFTYDSDSLQIKKGDMCVDYNDGNDDVYLGACNGKPNQKWRYMSQTKELLTFFDHKCLDYNADGQGNVYMNSCTGGSNQQFTVPAEWLPSITMGTFNKIRVVSEPYSCMTKSDDGNKFVMADCVDEGENQVSELSK